MRFHEDYVEEEYDDSIYNCYNVKYVDKKVNKHIRKNIEYIDTYDINLDYENYVSGLSITDISINFKNKECHDSYLEENDELIKHIDGVYFLYLKDKKVCPLELYYENYNLSQLKDMSRNYIENKIFKCDITTNRHCCHCGAVQHELPKQNNIPKYRFILSKIDSIESINDLMIFALSNDIVSIVHIILNMNCLVYSYTDIHKFMDIMIENGGYDSYDELKRFINTTDEKVLKEADRLGLKHIGECVDRILFG